MKCYICEQGTLKRTKAPFAIYGVGLGSFDAEVCPACREVFFTEESSDKIDAAAKKNGLWGLEAKTKIGLVGNSIDVKISKRLAAFTGMKKGEEVRIYPEGKNKLIIETN